MPPRPPAEAPHTRAREQLIDELRGIADRARATTLIRELQRDHGMSLNEISATAGIPRTTAQRWAKGAEEEQ
ncbi:hypothetical protein ABZ215_25025 [Amycolatopsis sp. NPDC006131]|uniref:hypothetical protein n=1 Tax=Amycolatopsis sp. NPDC006131 TaxID=3156731 RepID=UPI0033AF5DB9